MKFSTVILALLLSTTSARAEPHIESNKAPFHVGSEAMICGKVVEVRGFTKGTYLNMGAPYPNQHISVVIWNSNEEGFTKRFGSLSLFQGRSACVRGLIESYRGGLQVKVANPQFLRLMKYS